MTGQRKPVVYSEKYDVRLEPARLAYGISKTPIDDVELEDPKMVSCVKVRSPTSELPFAAVDDILIAGPVTILYHAAYTSDLMPGEDEAVNLLEATMLCEQVHNILCSLVPLQRSPYSVPKQMDSTTDRLMTVDVPDGLKTLEKYAIARDMRPVAERMTDVADIAISALHYYLTELTDLYSAEDVASLYPTIHLIACEVGKLRSVSEWRTQRIKDLMSRGSERFKRCL